MDKVLLALLAIVVPILIYFRMGRRGRSEVQGIPETVPSDPAEKAHLSEQETKNKPVGGETYQRGEEDGSIQSSVDVDSVESLALSQTMTALSRGGEVGHDPREDGISSGTAVLPEEAKGEGQRATHDSQEEVEGRRGTPLVKRPPRRRLRRPMPAGQEPYRVRELRPPKPELICLNRERKWVLAVEISESLVENASLIVSQDRTALTSTELGENRRLLTRLSSQVVVAWSESGIGKEAKIPLGEEVGLLFKLSGRDRKRGRRVKFPSSGSYLVIAPSGWKRDVEVSGPPPVAPEFVSLPGQTAHFFELQREGGGGIAFHIPSGKLVAFDIVMPRFELVGIRLDDASENVGPVFSRQLPRIRALDNQFWNEVATIVIGEEGNEKRTWNVQFNPDPRELEQSLPSEVEERGDGWYFIRFYDTDDDLIESQDFRFIRGVQELNVLQPPIFPRQGGHEPVCIECIHVPGYTVRLDDGTGTDVLIERKENKTVLNIPPDVSRDRTRWFLGLERGPFVEVSFLVERCWWALGEENEVPTKWMDAALVLSAGDFRATSKKALWLRFPERGWVREVLVGFEQRRGKRYSVRVTENTVGIPLRDFEIVDPERDHALKVWVQKGPGRTEEAVLGLISRTPVPPKDSSKPTPFKDYAEDSAWLRFHLPRLATIVTHLKGVSSGPLRILIREIRKEYRGPRVRRQRSSKEFVRKAICLIVMSSEGKENSQLPRSLKRWLPRARAVRANYSETMRDIQNRYEELLRNSGSAR